MLKNKIAEEVKKGHELSLIKLVEHLVDRLTPGPPA